MLETTRPTFEAPPSPMITLMFNARRVIIPRPLNYGIAVVYVRNNFPEIASFPTVKFLSDELDICKGQLAEISQESWRTVINVITSLTVSVSLDVPRSPRSSAALVPLAESDPFIQIKIISAINRPFHFTCHPSTAIQKLIDAYQLEMGGEHRLLFGAGYLDGTRRFSDYGICDGAVIRSVSTLRGGKPVIYLFSPNEIEATVSLSPVPEWELSAIYPVVPIKSAVNGKGQTVEWRVQTKTNGDLVELNIGLNVSYLFWEAHTKGVSSILSPPASPALGESPSILEHFNPVAPNLTVSNSVILPTKEITPYLDKALNALGLHTEARTSFITYWLPSFLKHKHIALRFLPQMAYERAAPLNVSPKPDITTRIFMLFKGVEHEELPYWKDAIDRALQDVHFWVSIVGVDVERASDASLFRVLEWGGMEVVCCGQESPRLEEAQITEF